MLKNSRTLQNKNGKNRPNTIMLVDRDLIRKLIIPRNNQNTKSTVYLSKNEFQKIKNDAQKTLQWEDQQKANDMNNIIQEEIKKQEALKEEIKSMKCARIPAEIDEENKLENERILARTKQIKREQDDIVKRCNSLIFSMKCKAIQNAQISEKKLVRQGFRQYENYTDQMMEEVRNRALQTMQKKQELESAAKRKYAESILQQIQENEKKRLLQMQRMQREFKMLKLKKQKYLNEETRNSQRLFILQNQLKSQNEYINEQIKRKKDLLREQEKLENIKVQELVKRKLEEEKELEKSKKKEKQNLERELARLCKLQKNTDSLRQLKDEIIHERVQEQMQRQWREKELETARKKKLDAETLKSVRNEQIYQKRKQQVWITEEKKKQAEKFFCENEQLRNEIQQFQIKQKQVIDEYKKALKEQMNEKESKKQLERQQALKEREEILNEIQRHNQTLKETIQKKIDETKSCNIPTSYIKHVEKQINSFIWRNGTTH